MSDPEIRTEGVRKESFAFSLGGAAFLMLAGFFLWRDLALSRELLILVAALIAGTAAVLERPRRWPALTPAALLAVTGTAGLWFLAEKRPGLLPALAVVLVAAVVSVIRAEAQMRVPLPPFELRQNALGVDLAARLRWYGLGAALLVTTSAFYFHFLTTGVAADSVVRRLVPTVFWLALGLGMFIAGRTTALPPTRYAAHVGVGLMSVALLKALAYDTTHLTGGLRIAVLAAVGGLLLFGARLLRRLSTPTPTPHSPSSSASAAVGMTQHKGRP